MHDHPLLVEMGMAQACDLVVIIDVPEVNFSRGMSDGVRASSMGTVESVGNTWGNRMSRCRCAGQLRGDDVL